MTRTIGKVGSGQPPVYRSNRKSMKRWTLGERRVAGGRECTMRFAAENKSSRHAPP